MYKTEKYPENLKLTWPMNSINSAGNEKRETVSLQRR